MGCASCSSNKNGTPSGCGNNGFCTSGGCNKLNTFDWLSKLEMNDPGDTSLVEVSFKNGGRKDFYHLQRKNQAITGDVVVVDTGNGYDVGKITLTGELVNLQLRKKRIPTDRIFNVVLRKANERDIQKLNEGRSLEREALIRSRAIARTLDLDMKIGDVEYQGDKRKATFYYTADGRVDFRELVKSFAKEFRVKIEMRQIGSRQESGKIGGVGSCGRELCCSTWLTDFKSVTTTAARYQNIAINQSKLSGQCGRLKCCLNYELDTYMDALEDFPIDMEEIPLLSGKAVLTKTDIFKGLMFYYIDYSDKTRGKVITLDKSRVKELKIKLQNGETITELQSGSYEANGNGDDMDFADVTGQIELPAEKKKRRKPRGRKGGNPKTKGNQRPSNRGNKGNKSNNQKRSNNSDKRSKK